MKSVFALVLTLMSANAMALTADVAGVKKAFQITEKILCRDVTPLMAEANMKAGINIIILLSQAEELKKAGKLEEAAKAEADAQAIGNMSSEFSTQFNEKCVAAEAVFAEQ